MPTTSKKPTTLDACNPALNATVSASAGSGKTWLLITRIVRLLLDDAEPGNIIALTFTRKAAAEMQIRLNQRLFEMATATEEELEALLKLIGSETNTSSRTTARSLYEKLMHSLYPIRIQTFHAFCQDILSRFPLEADIPPGFTLLEDSSLLERQAWQTLFENASYSAAPASEKKPGNPLADALDIIMHACNGPENTRTALNSFLSHRSDWWAYTAHTQEPVDFACRELAQSLQLDDSTHDDTADDGSTNNGSAHLENDELISQFLNEKTKNNLMVFANLLREIKLKKGLTQADSIDKALADDNIDKNTAFSLIRSAFIKKDGDAFTQGRQYTPTLEKKLGSDKSSLFIELHETIAAAILTLDETLKRLQSWRINKAWYFAGQQYIDIFQRLKREMRLLDFTDLEWKCYQLLQNDDNAHWVQYKIDQRIDHLLIDEFQDTNPTQWQLLSPILDEIAANPEERRRSVFLVGDEKQSIYSFRRANPALQAQASDWLAQNLGAKATPLDSSRRSSNAIIHCVNQIFEQDTVKSMMTDFTTHDTYLNTLPGKVFLCDLFVQEDDNLLQEHVSLKDRQQEDLPQEDVLQDNIQQEAQQTFRNPLEQAREISVTTLRHQEADYIAKQILQLVNTPELITDDGTVRAAEYGDVLILMRNRTHIKIYEDTLKHYAIPFIGSKKGGLLDNLEIQDLICLLDTLITPFNNLALAQVLKSPIFDASDDDLIFLAQHNSINSGHWYERLLHLADKSDADKEAGVEKLPLSKALRRASTLLPRWQKLAEKLPVHDCLDKIFSQGNIIQRYVAANKTENKLKVAANCQCFLELSLETDSGRYPSITRFLQHLKHLKNYSQSPPEEPLSQSNESRVRLMTIHGSKGLEAPIVFLADCNSTASNKNAYASLVRWPAESSQPVNFQLQLSKTNTDSVTLKLQQEKLHEQAREDLNLLYVALTRAREHLYISGVESRSKKNDSWYQIINSGLADVQQENTSIEGISGRTYKHLSYESSSMTVLPKSDLPKTDLSAGTESPLKIDERLLKPIVTDLRSSFMIAPSLGLHTSQDNEAPYLSDTIKDSTHPEATNAEMTAAESATIELTRWRGVIIHRALEKLCQTKDYPANTNEVKQIQQCLTAEVELSRPALIKCLDSCVQEAVATFNHVNFSEIFKPNEEAKTYDEMPLMYMDGKQAVYGIIDRVIKTRDCALIIDYKSHQIENDESIKNAAQQFSKQLSYYHKGINKLWPDHEIKSGILFTHHKQLIWL